MIKHVLHLRCSSAINEEGTLLIFDCLIGIRVPGDLVDQPGAAKLGSCGDKLGSLVSTLVSHILANVTYFADMWYGPLQAFTNPWASSAGSSETSSFHKKRLS